MSRSHHLILIDLMAAIAAGALPLYLLRGAWIALWYALLMVAAPLAGALLQRSRGGRGITGGVVGGVAVLGYLAVCQAVALGPEWRHLGLLLFGGAFGATLGLATWALAGLGRRFASRRPPLRRPARRFNSLFRVSSIKLPTIAAEDNETTIQVKRSQFIGCRATGGGDACHGPPIGDFGIPRMGDGRPVRLRSAVAEQDAPRGGLPPRDRQCNRIPAPYRPVPPPKPRGLPARSTMGLYPPASAPFLAKPRPRTLRFRHAQRAPPPLLTAGRQGDPKRGRGDDEQQEGAASRLPRELDPAGPGPT